MTRSVHPALFVLVAVLAMASCEYGLGPEAQTTAQALLSESQVVIDSLGRQLAEARARLADVEMTDAERAETDQVLAQLEAIRAQLQAAKDTAGGALDASGNVTPEGVAATAAPFLPPPWNVIMPALVGLGAGWWRERKTRSGFERLVKALNAAKDKHADFATAMNGASATIRERLGPVLADFIDTMRTNGGKLPILR